MRILHVLDHSLPVQSGYAFRSDCILREQRALGWETVQVTSPKHGAFTGATETIDGLTFHRTSHSAPWWGHMPLLDQWAIVRSLRRRLRGLVRECRPDLIQAHSPCLNGLAALNLGVPLVYEFRSSWEDAAVSTGTTTEGSVRYRLSRMLETHVLHRADAVTTICDGLRIEAESRGVPADRIAVIPNAVDPAKLGIRSVDANTARRQFAVTGSPVIGFVGSYFAWEGLDVLLEALPAILAKQPALQVLLVGGGQHEPALRSIVQRLKLESHVIFAGSIPHDRVPEAYAAIDLLVYPRIRMRLTDMVTPLKPLEAMALGKPFVASDVGGHRELVRDGETGVLFRAGDRDALAACVLKVLGDASMRSKLAANGPPEIRRERNWPNSVRRYAALYDMLLAGRTRS